MDIRDLLDRLREGHPLVLGAFLDTMSDEEYEAFVDSLVAGARSESGALLAAHAGPGRSAATGRPGELYAAIGGPEFGQAIREAMSKSSAIVERDSLPPGSELRRNPLTREWTIVAAERGQRPNDFRSSGDAASLPCPCCPGNEAMTPPEVFAERPPESKPDQPGWQLRVVRNKFPALRDVSSSASVSYVEGLFSTLPGVGKHEMFIETPRHDHDLVDLSVERVAAVLGAYQERLKVHARDRRLKYGLIFRNHGEEAGQSLKHAHSQGMWTTVVPPKVVAELDSSHRHFEQYGRCLLDDVIGQEVQEPRERRRIVSENDDFIAFCPYAARSPFELMLTSRRHVHAFELLSRDELGALAALLHDVLRRLKEALHDPSYNMVVYTAPYEYWQRGRERSTLEQAYHFRLEIIPQRTRVGGFEVGSGVYINPVVPEAAARVLREWDAD